MSPVIALRAPDSSPLAPRSAPALVFQDPRIQDSLRLAQRATGLGLPILLAGESGTGKEYLAQEIHRLSGRSGPFVAVNCAALPEALAVAELFGHAEGAYTGARRGGAEGRIAQADGGTLMLDEIGDMPLSLQVTLLRFLDNFQIRPLGQSRDRQVDVQIIAATHVDLREAVQRGRFRHDLLYRLNTLEVHIPPLRERHDFVTIVQAAWAGIAQAPALSHAALQRLRQHRWEGNMRELKGVLHRLAFRYPGQAVDADQVARELPPTVAAPPAPEPLPSRTVRDVTDHLLQEQLRACNGNISETARRLGLSRTTMYRYMARQAAAG